MVEKRKTAKNKIKSYKDLLDLPQKLQEKLPNSFDVIGNISIIKLPSELIKYKNLIGDALIKSNKNIKTVCLTKAVTGELRKRDIEIIAGIKNTVTTHKEYGLRFELDVKKVYFSPRLATERRYIAQQVRPNETIIDMFAGIGPFSIMIAKYSEPKIVYAIDKNPDAINYAKKNLILNKSLDKVEIIHGDSKKVCAKLAQNNIFADRIIMNLPFSAYNFFEDSLKLVNSTTKIHLYDMTDEESINQKLKYLKKVGKKNSIEIKFDKQRKIKSYGPREFYMGIDITAKKMPM